MDLKFNEVCLKFILFLLSRLMTAAHNTDFIDIIHIQASSEVQKLVNFKLFTDDLGETLSESELSILRKPPYVS